MKEFWQSMVDDLVFQHCDGEGLNGLLGEWLCDENFDLEWTRDGFELVPWTYDVNPNRLEFVYNGNSLRVYNEDGDMSLIGKEIGVERMRAIEVILREVQLCGTKV